MPADHRERAFEAAIEHYLVNHASFKRGDASQFEREEIASNIDLTNLRIDAIAKKVNLALRLLCRLRSALITAAVTGQIDVRTYKGGLPCE